MKTSKINTVFLSLTAQTEQFFDYFRRKRQKNTRKTPSGLDDKTEMCFMSKIKQHEKTA